MTDKTSHVFHSVDEHSNPVLARVFITPNTIAVSERVLRETITPGVMTEVVLHRLYCQITRALEGRGLQLGTSLAVMGLPRWEH